MLGVRGDEHHQRWVRHVAQRGGQLQAVGAGHVDVDQRHVERLVLRQCQRLGGAVGLAGGQRRGLAAVAQQHAQARARQRLVVHDQHTQRHRSPLAGIGTSMRA